ncbi:MAG: class I tRNA ligase family protein, partial [Acidimicrobiia bacterium]|nr:class I tRNA ligase family protein [Acidimicrobiia bacterium]
LYNFAWAEVFDWYLEMSKPALAGAENAAATRQTLGVVMRDLLKLFHPAIPFLTEELWSHLVGEGLLAGSDWPQAPVYEPTPEMEDLKALVSGVRQFRAAQGLSHRRSFLLGVTGQPPGWVETLVEELAGVEVENLAEAPGDGHIHLPAGRWEGYIPLQGLVDPEAERRRIDRAIARLETQVSRSCRKLSNQNFTERAPAAVVEGERKKLAEASGRLRSLRSRREALVE